MYCQVPYSLLHNAIQMGLWCSSYHIYFSLQPSGFESQHKKVDTRRLSNRQLYFYFVTFCSMERYSTLEQHQKYFISWLYLLFCPLFQVYLMFRFSTKYKYVFLSCLKLFRLGVVMTKIAPKHIVSRKKLLKYKIKFSINRGKVPLFHS